MTIALRQFEIVGESDGSEATVGVLEKGRHRQAMRAGGVNIGEVEVGDRSRLGRQGLVECSGFLAFAVGLVITVVAEDGGDRDALRGGLAEVPATVAISVRGQDPVLFEESGLLGRERSTTAPMFSRSSSKLVISLTAA